MKIGNVFAIAIACALMASCFAGFAAKADVVNEDNDWNLFVPVDNWTWPWIDGTDLDDQVYYVGEQDVDFEVIWYNEGTDSTTDDDAGLTSLSTAIGATVRDVDGNAVTSPLSNWDDDEVSIAFTLSEDDWESFDGFQFDIADDAEPGWYNLTVILTFTDAAGVQEQEAWIHFEIRERATVGDIGGLIPGDRNKQIGVQVAEDAWMEDVTLFITRPDSDFTWFGTTSATASASFPGIMSGFEYFEYMLSVSADKDAGIYTGAYVITYTNEDGIDCTEHGEISFMVGNLAMLGTTTTVTTIDQGTTSVDFILSVTNTGTVDLFSIKLYVDMASSDFTFVPADHWEGDSTVSYAWVEVGDLDVGESRDVPMTVGFESFIPEGMHKLMFAFDGFYYDPDEMGYRTVEMWWTGSNPCAPRVVMNGFGFTLTPDESTVAGPYVMLDVVDDAIDFALISTTELSTGGQLVDNGVTVSLQNYGAIDYTNVVLAMETNSADSPFLNAVDPTAAESEPVVMSGTVYGGNPPYSVTFRVTLRDDADMGIFMVPVNIRAVNKDMGVFVEDTVEARITVMGVGPMLVITSVSPKSINPGSNFDLTLTIENQGDDTARNVILWSSNNPMTGTGNSEENGDLEAPVPLVSPIVLPDIGPGDNITVVIQMRSNADMSGGHVYQVSLGISYVDSYGYGPSSSETYYDVAIKSSGFGGSALGNLYFVLMLVSFVVFAAIIVIAYVWARKNWVPRRKKNAPVIVGQQPAYEQQPPPQQ